jgi:DNA-binding transcriptional ArsR family regulator
MSSNEPSPQLIWDLGPAYDLFMSLDVLHNPDQFGLRGAWAAGVRSRLAIPERETLQQVHRIFSKGHFLWVHHLPQPKDGATVLNALAQIPAEERFQRLFIYPHMDEQVQAVLAEVADRQRWNEADVEPLRTFYQNEAISRKEIVRFLELWTQSRALGDRYLQALTAYHEVFFAEEESRIQPALIAALDRAKQLARQLDVLSLLEEISEGLRFGQTLRVDELVLVPSYWITPLIMYEQVTPTQMLYVFGARPANASLVPGEVVPDALFRALKALADPTRLRILRYLMAKPLTPSQLSRRLRLRAPTVVHHLRTLRLAGLVHLTLDSGKNVRYTVRSEAIKGLVDHLNNFLENGNP